MTVAIFVDKLSDVETPSLSLSGRRIATSRMAAQPRTHVRVWRIRRIQKYCEKERGDLEHETEKERGSPLSTSDASSTSLTPSTSPFLLFLIKKSSFCRPIGSSPVLEASNLHRRRRQSLRRLGTAIQEVLLFFTPLLRLSLSRSSANSNATWKILSGYLQEPFPIKEQSSIPQFPPLASFCPHLFFKISLQAPFLSNPHFQSLFSLSHRKNNLSKDSQVWFSSPISFKYCFSNLTASFIFIIFSNINTIMTSLPLLFVYIPSSI